MLKGKLKLSVPDKARRVFPDRLGSLIAAFDDKTDEFGGSESQSGFGKELEPIRPDRLGFHCESDDGVEIEGTDDDDMDQKIRQRPKKDVHILVSVLKSISVDKKISDIEYEMSVISQRVIKLEKLQRIASIGIPDGGGLRATAWKVKPASFSWVACLHLITCGRSN